MAFYHVLSKLKFFLQKCLGFKIFLYFCIVHTHTFERIGGTATYWKFGF